MRPGKFITFEGIEGVGKTTNIKQFASWIEAQGLPLLLTREPGGTPIAEAVRSVLLEDYSEPMEPDTETLLFYASRAQHIAQKIKPALALGHYVVCDRFADATIAYQGAGRDKDLQRLEQLNAWVLQDFAPDYTILLDAPVAVGLERIQQRKSLDRIEKEQVDFFERVRSCYLNLAKAHPNRFRVVDASVDLNQVKSQLKQIFEEIVHA